jgi:hypothetical protein
MNNPFRSNHPRILNRSQHSMCHLIGGFSTFAVTHDPVGIDRIVDTLEEGGE